MARVGTRGWRLITLVLALTLVAAACGTDDDDEGAQPTETTQAEEAVKGGTLVIGAEQELDCADWISSCAGASWGIWVLGAHTMPRAFDFTPENETVPSILLDGEPELETEPKQKVTYKISEDAVWSDGTPITSSDFKYTWEQVVNGTDIYDRVGYVDVESVDDSDPKTAVVTFKRPYAAWKTQLFGGFYGVYPRHLLEGKDRNAEMKDGYKFSGGPWIMESWNKGVDVTLVPNPRYWGKKPNLDKVVFKFVTDTAAEVQAYKTGQVMMIQPQAQLELAELRNAPDTVFDVITSLHYEALWLNVEKFPLDSKAVRQALAYATDRDAIVQQLFAPVQPDIKPIQALMTPGNAVWYPSTGEPFKKFRRDLAKVDELMTGDGWRKGPDGIWAKGGRKATVESNSTAGNKRRELTQQILQSQWKEAGFELRINNTRAGTLFGEWAPQGIMVMGLYAQVPSSDDPSLGGCAIFCSENIPTPANGNSGQNWTRLPSDGLDRAFRALDTQLDEDARKEALREGQRALAEEVPAIPIDPFPDVIVHSTRIGGPVGHNLVYGAFWNMNEWFIKA